MAARKSADADTKAGRKGKGKEKGKRKGRGGPGTGPPAFDPLTWGLLLAAVAAGPSLYGLYASGNLDLTTALVRGGLVALGCAVGVTFVNRLIADYRYEVDRERRIQEMMDSLEEVVHEGLPIPPGGPHPAPGPGTGPAVPGQTLPGQSLAGQTLPGQTVPGQTLPGQAAAGPVVPGQGIAGRPGTAGPLTRPG